MSRWVVGVDGGGTRTRALLEAGAAGDSVGSGAAREVEVREGPPALIDPSRPEDAARVVANLVLEVLDAARVPRADAAWVGLAGAGRERVRLEVEGMLRRLLDDRVRTVALGTDVEAALQDAFGAEPGIVLVAGTGSVAVGVDGRGSRVSVGGWGTHLGDEGSGYRLGSEALRAVLRAHDGRGSPTRLAALIDPLGLASPTELVTWIAGASKRDVAALAPEVVRTSDEGDAVAQALVAETISELRTMVRTVLDRLPEHGVGPMPIALVGGLIQPGRPLRRRVVAMATELGLQPLTAPIRGERGAADRAWRLVAPG